MAEPIEDVDLTATGTVFAGKAELHAAVLTSSGATATLIVRDGGAGGRVMLRLQAGTSQVSAIFCPAKPMKAETDLHATITGAGAAASFGIQRRQ